MTDLGLIPFFQVGICCFSSTIFFFDDAVFSSACISGILAEYQGTVITRLHLSFLFYSIDLHVCLSTSTVLFFVLWLCNIS